MRKIFTAVAVIFTLAGCASSDQLAIMKDNRDKAELTPQLRAMIARDVFATDYKHLTQLSPAALAAQPIKEADISAVQNDRDILGGGTLYPVYCVSISREPNFGYVLLRKDFNRTYRVLLTPKASGGYATHVSWKEQLGGNSATSSDTCSLGGETPFPELVQLERSAEDGIASSGVPDNSTKSQ